MTRGNFIFTVLALSLAVSCGKEPFEDERPALEPPLSGVPLTIQVNLPGPLDEEDSTGTKAALAIDGTAGKITWEEGDEICVYNTVTYEEGGAGAKAHKLILVSGAGTSKGTFYCDSFDGTPKAAIYPYEWATDFNRTSEDRLRYDVPTGINLALGDKTPIVLAANITDGKTINFKHTSGYFRFTVNDIPDGITSLTYSADAISSGYGVSGRFYMSLANVGSKSPKVSGTAGSTFTVTFPAGTKSGVFLVPVAAGQRAACRIWFNDANGKVTGSEKQLNKGAAYTSAQQGRGKLHDMAAFSLQKWIDDYEADKLNIKFSNIWEDLIVGETSQLDCELSGGRYDPSKSYTISYSSSNEDVASVSSSGKITAKTVGKTTITASVAGGTNTAAREYVVTDFSSITGSYSKDLKFRTGYQHNISDGSVVLHSNSVIQSWDWTAGNTYFSQVNGGRSSMAVSRCNVAGTNSAKFLFHFSGHGGTICKEDNGDGIVWLWLPNYGTIDYNKAEPSTGKIYYTHNQTICRVPASTYKNGDIFDPWDITEHYVFQTGSNYLRDLQVAIDEDNGLLALWGINPNLSVGSNIKFRVYRMSDVKSLVKKSVTLKPLDYGGYTEESTGVVYPMEKGAVHTIQAYNFADIKPIISIVVPTHLSYVQEPQGMEYYHNKLYYNYGGGSQTAGSNTHILVVIDPDTAQIVAKKSVPWVNTSGVISEFSATGYFEPEGVKIQDGCVYLGWAGIGTSDPDNMDNRCGHIFRFAL